MEAKCSIAPDIIWNWVIEALATFEQAEASTLIGLVRMAPAISGDLGKDAREAVSFKILESLFLHGNDAVVDADSAQTAKISFDSSERCEDVLQKILHETPEHTAKLEKEKWNIRPFLTHKRSSLPKCVLKKLKEVILESSHPLLESLKEKSKLVIPNASENINPVKDGNFDVQDKGNFQEDVLQEPDRPETVTNTERIDDDQTYIASQKEAFMSSQCTLNQDSLINLCMKCNEGGQLLVCNSDACPLQIHESCLGFAVTLDENGNFFCPFCAYSRAISKYQEAKRRAFQARNDLQAFSSFPVKPRHNKSSSDLGGKNVPSAENSVLPEASRSCDNDNVLCGHKGVSVANQSLTENEGQNVDKGCQSPSQAVNDPGPKYPSFSDNGCLNPIPKPSTPNQKCKEKESQWSVDSSCSRELRKRKAQYTLQVTPLLRRKILPWTKSEEETLKEGVEKYSSVIYKGIPWKEILDFGHKVFQRGRTPIDLKDKWRNMCKRSSRGK